MKKWFTYLSSFEKKFILLYSIFAFCLLLYTFTQVDLGLTLTRSSFITDVQRAFQHIGYFNRPLSSIIYILILLSFFVLYMLSVKAVSSKKISEKGLLLIIIFITILLAFSYAAFSYDIFNYIFDARILTHYQQNPYEHKALDYMGDPMLGFMHWTHRTYPYGPLWLLITLPFSYLGLQLFLPTYLMFKLLSVASYFLSVLAILKIAKKISPEKYLVSVAIFSLNPLIIFETLISGHNDLMMMAFSLIAFGYLLNASYIRSLFYLLFSIGIKFATGLLSPLFIFVWLFQKKMKLKNVTIVNLAVVAMAIAVVVASLRTNFQPWYLLYVLPFASLNLKRFSAIPFAILSFVGLLNYVPYLYTGNWDKPIPALLFYLNITGAVLAGVMGAYFFFKDKRGV